MPHGQTAKYRIAVHGGAHHRGVGSRVAARSSAWRACITQSSQVIANGHFVGRIRPDIVDFWRDLRG